MFLQTKRIRLTFQIICIILLAVLFAALINLSQVAAFAESERSVNSVVKEMSVFDNFEKNKRLYNVAIDHVSTNMNPDAKISSVKQLSGFDGSRFALFEMSPIGYAVYHVDSGKFVEYSPYSPSPYYGYSSNLYYGGGMQFYRLDGDTLSHTLKTDLKLSSSAIKELAEEFSPQYKSYSKTKVTDIVSYVDKGGTRPSAHTIKSVSAQKEAPQTRATPRINTTWYFIRLYTENQMGYRPNGACGYIATNILLGYLYYAYDYGLVLPFYVDVPNTCMNGPGLTNHLLTLAGQDPTIDDDKYSYPGTTAVDMYNVLSDYFTSVPNTLYWTCSWSILDANLTSTLDSGYPVVIFGNLKDPQPNSSGNINHAVVAFNWARYGFLNLGKMYFVHYGWSEYSYVLLYDPLIGNNLRLTINE